MQLFKKSCSSAIPLNKIVNNVYNLLAHWRLSIYNNHIVSLAMHSFKQKQFTVLLAEKTVNKERTCFYNSSVFQSKAAIHNIIQF